MSNEPDKNEHIDSDANMVNPFSPFQLMESVLEKLKLLDYEQQYCRRMRLKGFSKLSFAIPTNPGEQFNSFVSLAAWLIVQANGNMEQPQECDDPNATIATVLECLRNLGYSTEFPPSKLKSGCGEPCIRVLDLLASGAVKNKKITFELPIFTDNEINDPEIQETTHSEEDDDFVEFTGRKSKLSVQQNYATGIIFDSETENDCIDDDEAFLDLEGTSQTQIPTYTIAREFNQTDDSSQDPYGLFGSLLAHSQIGVLKHPEATQGVLESNINRGDWQLEVEHVMPQLRTTIRMESKDWRSHLEQISKHKTEIDACFKDSKGHLYRLLEELSRGLDKISSREKYMNNQVEQRLTEYRCAQDRFLDVKEKYRIASGGITERSKELIDLTDELELVKQEMDQRGSNMTDGSPVVRIKQAIQRLKAENIAMDIRIGVLEHSLLRTHLRAREESQKPLFTRFTVGSGLEAEFAFCS